jgi:hypothetical protein
MREDLLQGDEVAVRWALDALTWQQRLSPGVRMLLGLAAAVLAGVFGGEAACTGGPPACGACAPGSPAASQPAA